VSHVSSAHEAPLDIIREQPALLLDLLRLAGDPTADEKLTTELVDPEITVPSAHRADLVSILVDSRRATRRVVIVEVQRVRLAKKVRAWALYLAYLGVKHNGAPVTLLVVALNRRVAHWAREPRSLGTLRFTPLVIGPDDLPELQPDWATDLPLARATLEKVLEAYGMSALQLIFNEGKAAGQAEGKADTLLRQLRRRGFEVDGATEQRVRASTKVAELDAWLDRVIDAARLEDVFA